MGISEIKLWKWIRYSTRVWCRNKYTDSTLLKTIVACYILFAQTTAAVFSNDSLKTVVPALKLRPHQSHYTDQWAVHIPGGPEEAHLIASKHGFINTGQIFEDHYHFIHNSLPKRSIQPCHESNSRLSSESGVRWHAQQTLKRRVKRDYLEVAASQKSSNLNFKRRSTKKYQLTFTDPRWAAMWYLNRGPGLDMNVQEAWEEGITGKGIVVTILDDGLEKDHPDILRNYDPMASFDVNSLDNDPMPTYDLTDSNRHGTRCAGEVAAEANNSICAVGIAFEAGVGGVRMLDGDVTDAVEARSLSHNPQHIDIYSASWGPDDDGKTVDGPGELATRAFIEGVTKGRKGKGSIFVWASGNGGRDHDNCNCDGYTNSIWTLSISSATENGLVPWYSEACSSTLATTYSSGGTGEKQIVTIDLHHSCTSSHTGTSASAPLAAGICALALQANTNLTWRDMQHIVVRTARPHKLVAQDWATNGVGRNVSHSFGYGLMDAGAMVKLARRWVSVPEQSKCEVRAPYTDKNIPAKSKVTLEINVADCPGVNFLEHVQAKVTLTSAKRGDLLLALISPLGTRSVLLANRRHDINRSGFTDWPFMTVHCWGENPIGKWVLEIHNEGRYAGRTILKRWSLVLYGTREHINQDMVAETSEKSSVQHTQINLNGISSESDAISRVAKTDEGGGKVDSTSETPVVIRKPPRQRVFKFKPMMPKRPKASNISTPVPIPTSLLEVEPTPSSTLFKIPAAPQNKNVELPPSKVNSTSAILIPEDADDNEAASLPNPAVASTITSPEASSSTESQKGGKLQTWAVVLHGIAEDPNGPFQITLANAEESLKPSLHNKDIALEFDGSENKMVVEPSNIHNPQLAASHPEVADMNAVTSGGTPCLKSSVTGSCLECADGLYNFQDSCLTVCPLSFYGTFRKSINRKGVVVISGSGTCSPCHYSCRSCVGEMADNCSSCYNDSTLVTKYAPIGIVSTTCYPTHLLHSIENNAVWYRVLVVIIIINIIFLVILVVYICLRKRRDGQPLGNLGGNWLEKKGEYRRVSPDEDIPHDDDVIDIDRFNIQNGVPS